MVHHNHRVDCPFAMQVQMATVAKACAGLAWCINPCQVLYERKDKTLTFSVPPGTNLRPPWNKDHCRTGHPALGNNRNAVTRSEPPGTSMRLWAGGSPKGAPAWASFRDGGGSKGVQSAVAYATKQGHLIQVRKIRSILFDVLRGVGCLTS